MKFQFIGRDGDCLIWQRPLVNDSRVEEVCCSAEWFYAQMIREMAA